MHSRTLVHSNIIEFISINADIFIPDKLSKFYAIQFNDIKSNWWQKTFKNLINLMYKNKLIETLK